MKAKKDTSVRFAVYRRLLAYAWKYKIKFIGFVVLLFFAIILYSVAPYFTGVAINNFANYIIETSNQYLLNDLYISIAIVFACYLVYAIFLYLSNVLNVQINQLAIYDLRSDIENKISKLPLKYYDSTTYGDILARLTNDVEVVSVALQQSVFSIIRSFFTVVFMLIMMTTISIHLTFISLLVVPLLLIIAGKFSKKTRVYFDEQMKNTGELNGIIEEYYTGHNIVKLFNKQTVVQEKFQDANSNLYTNSYIAQNNGTCLFFTTISVNNLWYVLVVFVGVLIAIGGGLSIGMIQAFAEYLTQFTSPITQVMQQYSQILSAGASADRIFNFLDQEEDALESTNPKFPNPLQGNIKFENVDFGYSKDKILINNLNIDIAAGEKVAIVGPTGAGKTTLVNLIMRFYDVDRGGIFVDGVNINDMSRTNLRKIFGMVLQDTWLYCGTIMDNIRYGNPNASDKEVYDAAKAACAHDFIQSLPGSYSFIISENADNLAVGQRQLLTIARAILNKSPIMILDEATSSVDTRTEVLIQKAMDEAVKGRTCFVIAHRLSTIVNADKILYMQDGDIVEIGNHKQLMKKNGLYANLYNSQFSSSDNVD